MPFKKKAIPGTAQFNKLAADLPETREKIKAQVQFRHDLLEPLNKFMSRMSLIDFKVLRNCKDWMSTQN